MNNPHICSSSEQPAPLGTVLPCGCTLRAFLLSCESCSTKQWVASAVRAKVGRFARIQGNCHYCTTPMDQLIKVYKKPVSPKQHH